jgi:hypothetical protein
MPLGVPELVSETADAKFPTDWTVMADEASCPWTIVKLTGETEIVKSRVAELICTTKSILCLRKALVPVNRNVKVPTDALELAVTVRVTAAVPPGGGEASVAKLKVTPEGAELTQETDRPIGALKPLIEVTVIVVGALVPWTSEIDDGDADREKST